MDIAYLILAHNQPMLLARLVRTLDCNRARFFIHIDAKSDMAPFRSLLSGHSNVIFLEDAQRVKVYWGGYSQIQATLNLLAVADEYDSRFTRFCLLSGCDFPIKPLKQVREQLGGDLEFLRVDRCLEQSQSMAEPDGYGLRVRRKHFFDLPLPRAVKRRLLSGWLPQRDAAGIPLYQGAQWWALTGECGRYVRRFVRQHPGYCDFHRHVFAPDEIFFHSIVKQSSFAGKIVHDVESCGDRAQFFNSNDHGCHYIDWNAPQKVLPKILIDEDLPALLRSSALFARKFDTVNSQGLLNTLESMVARG